jgi:uncharacterized protein YndB with AHSA1/START domain
MDEVSLTRILNAPRRRVFQAWTHPDLMARWFFPGAKWSAVVSADIRVGGYYEVSMRDEDGGLHVQFGTYREIVPESRLVFTWSCPALAVVDSIVTVDLIDLGARTELRLTHELPPDPRIRRGHEEGWVGCLGNLEKSLSNQE